MNPEDDTRSGEEPERVVIRDNRKIDPMTGEARKRPDAPDLSDGPSATPVAEGAAAAANAQLLDERTRDLQRLQAEYANYRKRAERDRLAAGELAVGRVLNDLLPVIDDLDRAKAHGDLTGPLKAVADKLDAVLGKLGLVAFGEVGDAFDPAVHEAVMHDESPTVDVPTCTTVMRQGYKHNDRLLRPAMVGVSDPVHGAAQPEMVTETEGDQTAQGKHSETPAPPHEDEVPAQDDSSN